MMFGSDAGWRWFARRRSAEARVPHQEVTRAEVWAKTSGRCWMCGVSLGDDWTTPGWEVEHVWPRSKGGAGVLANYLPACKPCNDKKGTRLLAWPEGTMGRAIAATNRVAMRLAMIRMPVAPRSPLVAPGVVTLRFGVRPGHVRAAAGMTGEIRAEIRAPGATIRVVADELRVTIPRRVPRDVPAAEMPVGRGWFGVGRNDENQIVTIDFRLAPNVLAAGTSGGGKSEFLRLCAVQAIRMGAQIALVDIDGDTFDPLERSAALVCACANDVQAAAGVVQYVHRLMEARRIDPGQRPLFLLIDELHLLDTRTRELLQDIGQRCRKRAVFLVLATHRPVKEVITPTLADQCDWRVAMRVPSELGSRLIIGRGGAEFLAGRGDAIVVALGKEQRVKLAVVHPDTYGRLPNAEHVPAVPVASAFVDVRHARPDPDGDEARVDYLVERYEQQGHAPSVPPLAERFGGNASRNGRARDEACRRLGLPTPADRRQSLQAVVG